MLKGIQLTTLKMGTTQNIILIVIHQHITDCTKGIQLTFSYSSAIALTGKMQVVYLKQQGQRAVWGKAGVQGIAQLGTQGGKRIVTVHNSSLAVIPIHSMGITLMLNVPPKHSEKSGPLGSLPRVRTLTDFEKLA